MKILWFEFQLSLRRLLRRRTKTLIMLVTFSVSVSLSLLSWSLYHKMFLSNPDYDPQGEYLYLTHYGSHAAGHDHSKHDEMTAYKEGQQVFDEFAEFSPYISIEILGDEGAERLLGAFPSSRALQIMQAKPLIGRLFTADDDIVGAPAVVLLSESTWERRYNRDPAIIGQQINLAKTNAIVVGVLPKEFMYPNKQDIWISYGYCSDSYVKYQPLSIAMVRLKPGITKEIAEQQLKVIQNQMPPDSDARESDLNPELKTYRDLYIVEDTKVRAKVLFALSLLFVLVSCANAANLLLIEFLGSRAETASSISLGIPRYAIMRTLAIQVAIIAIVSALISIVALQSLGPLLYGFLQMISAPFWLKYDFAWHEVVMAFALAGVSGFIALLAPTVYTWRMDSEELIRDHGSANRGSGRSLWRRLLLIGQLAMLAVLGICAGLLLQSNQNVGKSQWGYDADKVFTGKISTQSMKFPYSEPERSSGRLAVHRKILDEFRALPATAYAAALHHSPGYSMNPDVRYSLKPSFQFDDGQGEAFSIRATEEFFEVLDVSYVAGEIYPAEETEGSPNYCVINESLAQKIWPHQDPLNQTLYVRWKWMKPEMAPLTFIIHGVVRDYQASGPTAKTNDSIVAPLSPRTDVAGSAHFLVRNKDGSIPKTAELAKAAHRVDPRISLYFPSTIGGQISITLSSVRVTTFLTGMFAAASVLLCAIGVYSLTITQVLQSSREFGIRMALGAEPVKLWWRFSRGHLLNTLIGVAIGIVGAVQLMKVFASLLYGVDPYGPTTYILVALFILVIAALACLPSLARLKKISPADCLRSL